MQINVLFFGACREALSQDELTLVIAPSSTVNQAVESISEQYPQILNFGNSLLFAINEEHSRKDDRLNDGDTLAIFPPVSGG